jgi:hypothetical protein
MSLQEDLLTSFLLIILVKMATRFLHGIKFFEPLWKSFTLGTVLPSLVETRQVVFHKKFFLVHYNYNLYNTHARTLARTLARTHTHARTLSICHRSCGGIKAHK